MKKLVVGDAIKLAIKTVGGSYGTLAPFVRLPDPQWLPSWRDGTLGQELGKRHCTGSGRTEPKTDPLTIHMAHIHR